MMASSKEKILHAAFALFLEQGYDATSYSEIAKRSGCGRPLVQYHFPKKESLAIMMVDSLLNAIANRIQEEDPVLRLLHVGHVYYTALLDGSGLRAFTNDILANRNITSQVIEENAAWSLPFLQGEGTEWKREASMQSIGGIYDLLYIGLRKDFVPDAGEAAARNAAAYLAFSEDARYSEELKRFRSLLMPDDAVQELAKDSIEDALACA